MLPLFASKLKYAYRLIRNTILDFGNDKAFRHGAAISYYTVFSLPAILIMVVRIAGWFFGEGTVKAEVVTQISELIGEASAKQVSDMIENISRDNSSWWATLLGVGSLIFGATGVFYTLQDSLNAVWKLQSHFQKGNLFKLIFDRLVSFAMVLSLGFILLVSMVLETLIVAINKLIRSMGDRFEVFLEERLPSLAQFADQINIIFWIAIGLNILFSLTVITLMFSLIFKFLPNANVSWRDVLIGAFFTAVLFILGELLIGWYIGNSNIASTYGAAGSIVIILLWVFYSANILLLGAEFTYTHARMNGREIKPSKLSVTLAHRPLTRLFRKNKHHSGNQEEE